MSAYVVAARRTAFGRVGGLHAARSVDALAAAALGAALGDARLPAEAVQCLILGNAAGGGGNPARRAALAAGLPEGMPALTVDTQCASGLSAILNAAQMIVAGVADIVVAGGAESPSTAPWRVARPPAPGALPRFTDTAPFAPEGHADPSMIEAAENVARHAGIARARQDAYACASRRRAAAADHAPQIVPLPGAMRDEQGGRPPPAAVLARAPALIPGGSVTAGNSCRVSDGAAFAVIVGAAVWRGLGAPPALHIIDGAHGAVAPSLAGLGAAAAAEALLARRPELASGLPDCDIVINEAFAAQVLATCDTLGVNADTINRRGGALAIGHPYGASGAALVTQLFHAGAAGRQLALIAGAGGVGAAIAMQKT